MKKPSIWLFLALLMGLVLLTYSNHFHNSIHFDDLHTIESNTYVHDWHNIPLFFKDATTFSYLPSNQSYRPLLSTTLAIDYHFSNELTTTLPFHITSFTFFILLGILMFVLFRRILTSVSSDPYTDWAALFAVAWFMLNPVCAETINYIIQRGDSLSTFFVVLGLVLYIISPLCKRYYLYLIPVVLGILTKPSALMFAPILLCYIILFETESGFISLFAKKKDVWLKILLGSVLAFIVCGVGYVFVSKMVPPTNVNGDISPLMYRISQPFIVCYYFLAWFAPIHLSVDTDWRVFGSFTDPYALLGYTFLLFTVFVIFVSSEYRSTRPIAFGLAWFLLANVPTSFVAFSEIENDHRMFFPFVGLSLAIVWTFYLLIMRAVKGVKIDPVVKIGFCTFLVVLLCGYGYGTYQRNKVWLNDITLWGDCTIKSPTNGRGYMNYGLALMRSGDLTGAEKCFSTGLYYWPYYPYLHVNMACLKAALGKREEAEQYFKTGVAYGAKSYPNSYYYYARFLAENNRRGEAIAQLYTAVTLPNIPMYCRYLLMEYLYDDKRFEELKKVAAEAQAVAPHDPEVDKYVKLAITGKSQLEIARDVAESNKSAENYLSLSLYAYNAGNYQECIDASRKALELRPNYALAYNNIGSACNQLKKYQEAKVALLKAIELEPANQLARNNLAIAEKGLQQQNK